MDQQAKNKNTSDVNLINMNTPAPIRAPSPESPSKNSVRKNITRLKYEKFHSLPSAEKKIEYLKSNKQEKSTKLYSKNDGWLASIDEVSAPEYGETNPNVGLNASGIMEVEGWKDKHVARFGAHKPYLQHLNLDDKRRWYPYQKQMDEHALTVYISVGNTNFYGDRFRDFLSTIALHNLSSVNIVLACSLHRHSGTFKKILDYLPNHQQIQAEQQQDVSDFFLATKRIKDIFSGETKIINNQRLNASQEILIKAREKGNDWLEENSSKLYSFIQIMQQRKIDVSFSRWEDLACSKEEQNFLDKMEVSRCYAPFIEYNPFFAVPSSKNLPYRRAQNSVLLHAFNHYAAAVYALLEQAAMHDSNDELWRRFLLAMDLSFKHEKKKKSTTGEQWQKTGFSNYVQDSKEINRANFIREALQEYFKYHQSNNRTINHHNDLYLQAASTSLDVDSGDINAQKKQIGQIAIVVLMKYHVEEVAQMLTQYSSYYLNPQQDQKPTQKSYYRFPQKKQFLLYPGEVSPLNALFYYLFIGYKAELSATLKTTEEIQKHPNSSEKNFLNLKELGLYVMLAKYTDHAQYTTIHALAKETPKTLTLSRLFKTKKAKYSDQDSGESSDSSDSSDSSYKETSWTDDLPKIRLSNSVDDNQSSLKPIATYFPAEPVHTPNGSPKSKASTPTVTSSINSSDNEEEHALSRTNSIEGENGHPSVPAVSPTHKEPPAPISTQPPYLSSTIPPEGSQTGQPNAFAPENAGSESAPTNKKHKKFKALMQLFRPSSK